MASILGVFSSPNGNARNGFWQITRGGTQTVLLNGSVAAGGIGPGTVRIYFPNAIARMPEDTMPGAAKLLGPESWQSRVLEFRCSIVELYRRTLMYFWHDFSGGIATRL